jgi:hypothetical protein
MQSRIQKGEEKAKERSGLKPEIGPREYMQYMNAVGGFMNPELGV